MFDLNPARTLYLTLTSRLCGCSPPTPPSTHLSDFFPPSLLGLMEEGVMLIAATLYRLPFLTDLNIGQVPRPTTTPLRPLSPAGSFT